MRNNDTGVIPSALAEAMAKRNMTAAKLARGTGVDKSTISLILAGERPNTPAIIVAKLADALDISVDYLVGLSDEMEPRQLHLGDILMELTRVAKQLTSRRQRDLLRAAHSYLAASEEMKADPDLMESELLDVIEEIGGKDSRDKLIDLLRRADFLGPDFDFLLGDEGEKPTNGDG